MKEKLTEYNKGFLEGLKEGIELNDQPLTSSIWGKRVYNKWYKEIWWWIQENICEIAIGVMSLITLVAIICAWIYHGSINL